jgi:NADH-quinone oxidoreductase subunit N
MLAQVQDAIQAPSIEWWHISPLLALVGGALVLLVAGALTPTWPRGGYAAVTALTAATAGVFSVLQWHSISDHGPATLLSGAIAFDAFAQMLTITICAATLLVALVTGDELHGSRRDGPEIYALLLIAAAGGVVMAAANDLIVLFIGLETLSLALYVLAASDRERRQSQESGIKYFVLGGFSSAFFLYGIALIYGGTQSTNISEIVASFQNSILLDGQDPLVLAGIALLIVGLGFKVAAVPFHVWTPDVYEGAPTNVTAFMASVGKAAAFAAMLRVLVIALPFHRDDWRPAIWVLALLSLAAGSVLAVVQTDVKRMLAYSSINHAGFILVGVEAAGHRAGENEIGDGLSSVTVYLLLYSVLTIGSFAVVSLVARNAGGDTSLTAFRGLAKRRPVLAVALTVFVLAQAGVPLTSGFVAKWGVIQAAVEERSYAIAIIAMVAAVVAAYLYLRIMVSVWLQDSTTEAVGREPMPVMTSLAVFLAAGFTLAIGVWPQWLLDVADGVSAYAR